MTRRIPPEAPLIPSGGGFAIYNSLSQAVLFEARLQSKTAPAVANDQQKRFPALATSSSLRAVLSLLFCPSDDAIKDFGKDL